MNAILIRCHLTETNMAFCWMHSDSPDFDGASGKGGFECVGAQIKTPVA